MTLAWWRCLRRSRVCRQVATSTAARSAAETGARRVSVAARIRTGPRTTRLGEATGGAPLMVALGPEERLQAVVGRWQAGNLQVVEQPRAVAPGDLEEALHRVAQAAAGGLALVPFFEQTGIAGLDVLGRPCCSGYEPRHGPSGTLSGCRATATGSAPSPSRAGSAASSTRPAGAPLFLDPPETGLDRLQARLASIASRRSCSRSPVAS